MARRSSSAAAKESPIAAPKRNPEQDSRLSQALLEWYARHRRDLPWRRSDDPYAVWVSEIMLQQTRVATVIPYFERWLERFPDAGALAAADEQEVLSAWQGLGYYSRARGLHRAARIIVEKHAGSLPSTADELRELPGIGPYTAGAIASIAFGRDEPAVDGNVIRVLSRLHTIEGDPQRVPVRRSIDDLARALIPAGQAADFNQALMELGATLCLPRGARCDECPVRAHCAALRTDRVADFPQLRKRPAPSVRRHLALLALRDHEVLVEQMAPDAPWWAGLWRLPTVELQAGESGRAAAERAADLCLGPGARVVGLRTELVHHVTRFRVQLQLWQVEIEDAEVAPGLRWRSRSDLKQLPLPAPYRKLVRQLGLDAG